METTLAILMTLGIFLGVPMLIGFTIGGIFILSDRRAVRAERAKASAEVKVEELAHEPAKI